MRNGKTRVFRMALACLVCLIFGAGLVNVAAQEASTLVLPDGLRTIGVTNAALLEQVAELSGPEQRVLSPDLSRIFLWEPGSVLRAVDAATGADAGTIGIRTGETYQYVSVTPDGRLVAVVADQQAVVYNLEDRALVANVDLAEVPDRATFAPTGRYLAVHGAAFYTWQVNIDPPSIIIALTFDGPAYFAGPTAFSFDERYLASIDAEDPSTAIVWPASSSVNGFEGASPTPPRVARLTGEGAAVTALAFSPRVDPFMAVASNDDVIRMWNFGLREQLFSMSGHTDIVTALTFNDEGTLLASASNDGTVRVWDARTGDLLATLDLPYGAPSRIAFSADNRVLYANDEGDENTIRVWGVIAGTDAPPPCTVTALRDINLRTGPGTTFDSPEQLLGDYSLEADGVARDLEGATWYRLLNGLWVRSDLVRVTDQCVSLPEVTP